MTLIGIRLKDVPMTIGWDGLVVFARHLPPGSATMRNLADGGGEWADGWSSAFRTNELLAEVIDTLRVINWEYVSTHSKGHQKKPQMVERPWVKDGRTRKFGKGAIPRNKFIDWYYNG